MMGRSRSGSVVWGGVLVTQLWLAACASAPVVAERAGPLAEVPIDRRVGWLLRLEAQRLLRDPQVTPVDPAALVEPAPARTPDLVALLRDVDASVRSRAALAIGRVGMAEGVAPLLIALADTDAAVRAQAAFGLGLLGRSEAGPPLGAALADPDLMVRGRAAEGLGLIATQLREAEAAVFRPVAAAAIGAAFATCGPVIAPLAPDAEEHPESPGIESCRLAILALARLREYEPLAQVVLAADGRAVSSWWPVAYALERVGDPRATPVLALLARTSGVYTVAYALRGIAATPDGLALSQRFAIDVSANPAVRVSAIRALGRRGSSDAADTLMALLDSSELSLTLELEVMAALAATEDERAFDRVLDRLLDRRPQIRAAAIAAAARINPDGFLLVISSLGAEREWSVRAALATTLGTLEPDRVRSGLIQMVEDQDQRVRGPALEALARVGAPDLDARLVAALEVPDYVVRATAARLLGERKTAEAVPALAAAYARGKSDAAFDARAAALTALAAIGGSDALDVVRQALVDRDWPMRWRAAELLHGAGDPDARPERPAALRQPEDFFESAGLLHPPFSPVAYIQTRLGTIEVALNVVESPLTTRAFIELAHAGFFNGLRIHRLVPNFVVQTGDPRGDGEGGPGFSIGDEVSPLSFGRGAVGMAKDWRDTGGSQFFITHSPQPPLDGRYTLFGQVVKGMDVVDRLSLHDVIERVRIWDGTVLK